VDFPRKRTTRRFRSDSTSDSLLGLVESSADHAFDDVGKPITGIGKAVKVVLALAAAVHDSAVPQQGQVVAQGRLAQVKLVAEPPDVTLPVRKQCHDLESGRVAELLEQNRCSAQGLGVHLGSLRRLLHLKNGCGHWNRSPKEVDRLEVEGYITLFAGELLDKRESEWGGRGRTDHRYSRFSIPVSKSIRFIGSRCSKC
jgi:hypothetical protein